MISECTEFRIFGCVSPPPGVEPYLDPKLYIRL